MLRMIIGGATVATGILLLTDLSAAPSVLSGQDSHNPGGQSPEQGTTFAHGERFRNCANCPEMIIIPPGRFIMGMSDGRAIDGPAHEVRIEKPFAVAVFSVTVGQFREFAAENPDYHTVAQCTDPGEQGRSSTVVGWTWDSPGFPQEDDHPAVCLSWYDMQEYLKWLNSRTDLPYRLLSEAEWEYIARAGIEDEDAIRANANHDYANFGAPFEECCKGAVEGADTWLHTSPVGAFPPNNFGVYDMNGNAENLLSDCMNADYVGAPNDGVSWTASQRTEHEESGDWSTTDGQCFSRVYRGQGWKFPPARNWFARRYWWPPHQGTTFLGFRVALDLH